MPRKSASHASVVQIPLIRERPRPPQGLTERQRASWEQITGALPVGYFTCEMSACLVELVRAIERSDEFSKWLDQHPPDTVRTPADLKVHEQMSKGYFAASAMVLRLSTRLRLTPQSRYCANNALATAGRSSVDGTPNEAPRRKPWERFSEN
jgi:hypothetical protein